MAVLGKGDAVDAAGLADGLLALNELGSVAYAKEKAEAYHQKAHECLDKLPASTALRALRELTDFQLARLS